MSDAPSKANAGLIGPLNLNELSPELRKLIESMKPGRDQRARSAPPAATSFSSSKRSTPPETLPFDQARNQIGERVFTDKRREEYDKFLERLRAQAIIEWKNDELKKAYEQGLSETQEAGGARPRAADRLLESWFAVWTRSRHEQVVREQLETQAASTRSCRRLRKWSRWKDRKKKIDWPLFPGYCFARFDPDDALPVLKCTGVVNIVSFEGKPAPIPEYELDSIRLLVASDLQFDPCPLIKEGHDGRSRPRPAQGVVGRLMRKDRARARLVLVGRSDRTGGERRGRRRRRQTVLVGVRSVVRDEDWPR